MTYALGETTPLGLRARMNRERSPSCGDGATGPPSAGTAATTPAGRAFLDTLLQLHMLTPSAVEDFVRRCGGPGADGASAEALGQGLVRDGLLTEYQVDRVLAGTTHGLILGSHLVLARLSAGGMGVVFLVEHALMRRRAAAKVLPVDDDCPASVLERFYGEMRVLSELHHPHIVTAYDAGLLPPPRDGMPALLFLVMELVPGGDLEQHVSDHGPVEIAQACDWVRQAACGLQAAHDRHLIHRDLKPSNLLLTADGQVKLVDFGLAREFSSRLTDPRAMIGTLEFMPPEQSIDPSAVRGEADIYGLGATLFFLLTGEPPYPRARSLAESLHRLRNDPPRRLRDLRPDVPAELDALVARMLDRDPARRPSLALNVMNALLPFGRWAAGCTDLAAPPEAPAAGPAGADEPAAGPRALLVDDQEEVRVLCRAVLERLGCHCDEAADGVTALQAVRQQPYDIVLLDLNLPDLHGTEVCARLRDQPPCAHLKIIVVSGAGDQDQLAETLTQGADDYIAKPFKARQLSAKVRHALRLKDAQDRADLLAEQLLQTNQQLEQSLHARAADVQQAQDALLSAMARLAELRDGETAGHLRRLQQYTRCLARAAAAAPPWTALVDEHFLEQLERCVPLHDIGKIGLPDDVLLKAGVLDPAERALMQTHPLIGDRILESLAREHGASLEFLTMAVGIVRHHHERFDGTGYPDELLGDAIPAAARLVAVADVYDALRRRRFHKPAWPHERAVRSILEESPGQFDPALLTAFARCHSEFERIYRETAE